MAAVDILNAFLYKWAQDGTVEALDDAQYKTGWSFIGPIPPSVEQFNKVHQIADEKSNWLYGSMASVFAAAGITPTAGSFVALRDSLRSAGLFQTAAPGNNTTLAATTAFVQAAVTAATGRLIAVRVFASGSTVYVPTAGTAFCDAMVVGGGGAGGGAAVTVSTQVSVGAGGGAGGTARRYGPVANFTGLTVTVGAGGPAGPSAGATGGTSSIGGLMTGLGGGGGAQGFAAVPPVTTLMGDGGSATGGTTFNAKGGPGGIAVAFTTGNLVSGPGGNSHIGGGAVGQPAGGFGGPGATAQANSGAGGGGALSLNGGPAQLGGAGGSGVVMIWEYA